MVRFPLSAQGENERIAICTLHLHMQLVWWVHPMGLDEEGTWRLRNALPNHRGSGSAHGGRRHGGGRRRGGRVRRLRHVLRVLRPVQS